MEDNIYTETLPNGFSFDMIRVEGGEFAMGGTDEEALFREKPVHQVRIDTFYLGKFPVTQAIWKSVIGSENNPSAFQGDQRPVEKVSWEDVVNKFLPVLNRITASSRPAGMEYRLPTEAEWEYAARGGIYKNPYLYSGSNKMKEVGWYKDNSYDETKPVGLKDPNELGLYDMSGNVYEWCADWFNENYYLECDKMGIALNPHGPEKGVNRSMRGGSYLRNSLYCRVTYRSYFGPTLGLDGFGFRLVLSPLKVGF